MVINEKPRKCGVSGFLIENGLGWDLFGYGVRLSPFFQHDASLQSTFETFRHVGFSYSK
ncbi:hypothetical protein EV199_1179 [Pseudobacter ginsenosidimutans]|uniref:Uncharacterized protein n=1 Tax=Pseudobacter ginsenosidimutans TaxID=661488 RepID=A0A4Q7N3E8_9BACT|nr:hypothetical protein EV199_1179 [Pseudobacter ginsenosidimutans]